MKPRPLVGVFLLKLFLTFTLIVVEHRFYSKYHSMKKILFLFLFLTNLIFVVAQPAALTTKKNPYKWMFGLSWSFIDDNGEPFTKLFDLPGSFNFEYFPTKLMVDRYLRKGWSMEGDLTYNKYYSNKLINDTTGVQGLFFSGDVHVKYSFKRFLRGAKWFDPYISMGLGVTYRTVRPQPLTPTVNTSFGANFWFSRRWGAQLQTTGKLGIVPDFYTSNSNYLQHSVGVVYRFTPKRKSSNSFSKRRHKWTDEKTRYNRRKNS